MIRVVVCLLLIASELVGASRDSRVDEQNMTSEMRVSVKPSSFQLSSSKEEGLNSITQHKANVHEENSETLSAVESAAESDSIARAAASMADMDEQSKDVQKILMVLGMDSRPDASFQNEASMRSIDKARARLKEVSQQSQHIADISHEMGSAMVQQHARLARYNSKLHQVAKETRSAVAEGDGNTEEESFNQLQQHTQNIKNWYSYMLHLRNARKSLRENQKSAIKAAVAAGISDEEIQELSGLNLAHKSTQDASAHASKVERQLSEEKKRKNKELEHSLIKSAHEMAQIENAAQEVLDGLNDYDLWKKHDDKSPQSLTKAAKVKAKLDSALKYLEKHENLVGQREHEINELMAQTGMGKLSSYME